MNLPELSKFLNKELDTNQIKLENGEACSLIFEDNIEIIVEPAENEEIVTIYTTFCTIPKDKKKQLTLYQNLLRIQLFGLATYDHTFSMDQDSENIMLHKNLKLSYREYKEFLDELNLFANVYQNWKTTLEKEKII